MSRPWTQRQRDVLKGRIERAICWAQVPEPYRNEARRLAIVVLDDMEKGYLDAAAQRRAVVNLAERLEKSA